MLDKGPAKEVIIKLPLTSLTSPLPPCPSFHIRYQSLNQPNDRVFGRGSNSSSYLDISALIYYKEIIFPQKRVTMQSHDILDTQAK